MDKGWRVKGVEGRGSEGGKKELGENDGVAEACTHCQ